MKEFKEYTYTLPDDVTFTPKKELKIKFNGYEIGDATFHHGFETSFEFMQAVARGGCYYVDGRYHEFESGDLVFDYETGTMWEVVE